jgi:hypothetical protein
MRGVFVLLFGIFTSFLAFSQGTINGTIKGLSQGDTLIITVQKSSELYFYQKIAGTGSDISYSFSNLILGKWAIKLDCKGYYFPGTQVVDLSGVSFTKNFTISKSPGTNYFYKWQDDSSYVGHAQQSYINDPLEFVIGNSTLKVAEDFSAINLFQAYGITLVNNKSTWTEEEAFRIFSTIKKIPIIQDYGHGEGVIRTVKSVWYITDDELVDDIQIQVISDMKYITISRKALTYSQPTVALVDGMRGTFFSNRLYNALVKYATDFGSNSAAIDQLAALSFGFEFLIPSAKLEGIMGETQSNFQAFSNNEKLWILSMFAELPTNMQKQNELRYMARRISGQRNPRYVSAPAIAWVGSGTIEWIETAFDQSNFADIQRLIIHEKAHFLWEFLFNKTLKDEWIKIGGWFEDPTSPSGWVTANTTESVSAYAHLKNPNEDMAETIAFYLTNPDKIRSVSLRKFEFIRDRVMNGRQYISKIREDLTFTVYNLFPDYNYPAKITGVDIEVLGKPEEDKIIRVKLTLSNQGDPRDKAKSAYFRLTSPIGTFIDFWLGADQTGYVLSSGDRRVSKFLKSGYWSVQQITIYDEVGNARYENNSNFGFKIFIDNPLEDIYSPVYQDPSLKLSVGTGKFSSFSPMEDQINGQLMKSIISEYEVFDDNELGYLGMNFAVPVYGQAGVNKEWQFGVMGGGNSNPYVVPSISSPKIRKVTYKYPIPEYYPTGFYKITQLILGDVAENRKYAYFMTDTTKFNATFNKNSKHLRDSVYIKTDFPDDLPPVLDPNRVFIKATPTNPTAPDGETLVEIEFWAKDSSRYDGNASGISIGYYNLRDPQGKEFTFYMQAQLDPRYGNGFYYLLKDPNGAGNIYRKYVVSTLLPKGSAPGKWGLASITLKDRAQNSKFFSFVETFIFDLEQVDPSQQVVPRVEITGKKVNVKNVENIGLSIACTNCKDKTYRARIYSLMGGNSVVKEGKMSQDSILVENVNLKGVNDGVLYTTVFILDSTRKVLGLGKANYSKDTVIPKDYLLKTNYANVGKSTVDSFLVKLETNELKGESKVEIYPESMNQNASFKNAFMNLLSASTDTIKIVKTNTTNKMEISSALIKILSDGKYIVKYTVIDSVGNEGVPIYGSFIKDTVSPSISFIKSGNSTYEIFVEINLSEAPIYDLTQAQVSVSHATISNFTKLSSIKYQLTLVPDCFGSIALNIAANTLVDLSRNFNLEQNFSSLTNGVGLPVGFEGTLNLSGTQLQSTNRKAMKINTSENLGNNKNSNYTATQAIELKPGFVAEKGTVFRATIGAGCQ